MKNIMDIMEQLYKDDEEQEHWPEYSTQDCYHAKEKPYYRVKDEQLDLFGDRQEGVTFRQRMRIER